MAFKQGDIYTSSGSAKLYNAWTPYVSKHDSSSFYNWEFDNAPLYDLEERTYELWEQAGFPTSAVPGLALTVSADTPTATLAADSTIFTSLSACVASIPKVVRFPVLIEVGNYGDLGTLELHNFRIEEGGSIEIINRNFGRVYSASAGIKAITSAPTNNASHTIPHQVSSLDLSSTLTDTSCVHISTPVLSSTVDERITESCSFLYANHNTRKAPLSVSLKRSFASVGVNIFGCNSYEMNNDGLDASLATLDISSLNQFTDVPLNRASYTAVDNTSGVITGNFYFNYLSSISIRNCTGPIYVRNFFVDSQNARDNGIEVINSDAVLENCLAMRAKEAGFKFSNSNVILSRSAAAYRNYQLLTTTTRAANKGYGFYAVNSNVVVSSTPLDTTSTSIGDAGALESDLAIIASRNYAGFVLENSKLSGGLSRSTLSDQLTQSIIGSELNTGYGLLLKNSEVNTKGLLDVYGNDVGIRGIGSTVTFEDLCIDSSQESGIFGEHSTFTWDSSSNPQAAGQNNKQQVDLSGNGQHINLLKNSSFSFERKNSTPLSYGNSIFRISHGAVKYGGGAVKEALPAISLDNGSIADLLHANIQVHGTSENISSKHSYGRAIKANHNSKVSCFGSGSGCTFIFGPAGRDFQKYMAGIYAHNSSEVNLHGPTAIAQFGVDVLVEDSSVLNIEPARMKSGALDVSAFDLSSGANHTSVELHSIRSCLVANKNSVINMRDLGAYQKNWARTDIGTAYLNTGVDYDSSSGGWDSADYTSSGCLQFYPNPQDTSAIDDLNLDDLVTGAGFSIPTIPIFTEVEGLNRFIENGEILNTSLAGTELANITQGGVCLRAVQDSVVNAKNVHFPLGPNTSPLNGMYYTTSGSECDKLMIWNLADTSRLEASYLSVSGMHPASIAYHGPSAFWASAVQGTSGGVANQVAASGMPIGTPDTGSLSILDVFGAGSSVWGFVSGATLFNTINTPQWPFSGVDTNQAFGGLVSTEQKGLVEIGVRTKSTVLAYDIGASANSSNNQGVFRIYWSPKPSAKVLQSDLSGYFSGTFPRTAAGDFSGVVGPAYQVFAQGYNMSSQLSSLILTDSDGNNITSSVYPDLLRQSWDTDGDGIPDQLWTSGHYYCNQFLDDNPTQCVVDESAAKTFANAQNASVRMSGRPQKVTVYRARSDAASNRGAEAYIGDTSGSIGFKSALIFDLSRDN